MPKVRTLYVVRANSNYYDGEAVSVFRTKKDATPDEDGFLSESPEMEEMCYEGWRRMTGVKLTLNKPQAIHISLGPVRK